MGERVTSLFSGIGGFEAGFSGSGLEPVLMCEIDPAAAAVLKTHFPGVDLKSDIRQLRDLPDCEILVAGWPCQDLSQAGRTAGISGEQSGLVDEVFRLVDASSKKPGTIILENVAFALSLQKGLAVRHVVEALAARGYRWAYRVLDTLEFGLPQRRRRLFICASREADPATILFQGVTEKAGGLTHPADIGFYWTEGNRGIGWTPDAVPPLKGGSSLSIPSPPAIWHKSKGAVFSVPGIEDAERLQGFEPGWTTPAAEVEGTDRVRWRLIGNAVSVPVTRWLSQRLAGSMNAEIPGLSGYLTEGVHNAATGGPQEAARYFRRLNEGPRQPVRQSLAMFGLSGQQPLSNRAAAGFLSRYSKSKLLINFDFQEALRDYCG